MDSNYLEYLVYRLNFAFMDPVSKEAVLMSYPAV